MVYLDQWFVSNILDRNLTDEKQKYYEDLISKIERLKGLQRIFIVVSDIHAQEMAKIAIDEKRKTLWGRLNSLGDGEIAIEGIDIFWSQFNRISQGHPEIFPWSDILDRDPNTWIVGARIILTRTSLLRIHNLYTPGVDQMNNAYREILENQMNSVPLDSDAQQCFEFICQLRRNELIEKSPNLKKSDLTQLPRLTLIGCAFEAQKLHRALHARKVGDGLPTNDKKFSMAYGVSSQNDSSHISIFAPYVDALLTDNAVRQKIMSAPVKDQVKNLRCQFFSTDNIESFEVWLNDLMNASESQEITIARRLLVNRAC